MKLVFPSRFCVGLSKRLACGFALLAAAFLATGCATGLYALATSEDIAMAVPSSFDYDGARANFAGAISLGSVKSLSGESNVKDFQSALHLSLYMNELLASDDTSTCYRLDAEINLTSSGIIFEKDADVIIHYRLTPAGSETPVLDETFETTDTKGWPLYEKAGPVVALLFTRRADIAEIPNPRDDAIKNNIGMFLGELSRLTPTRTTSKR